MTHIPKRSQLLSKLARTPSTWTFWLRISLAFARGSVPFGASFCPLICMIAFRSVKSLQRFLGSYRRALRRRRPGGHRVFSENEIKRAVSMSRETYWSTIERRIAIQAQDQRTTLRQRDRFRRRGRPRYFNRTARSAPMSRVVS